MTAISQRKTRLSLETSAEARYRSKMRAVIVEPDQQGFAVAFRLKGSRVRYEVSWRGLFDYAGQVPCQPAESREEAEARRTPRCPMISPHSDTQALSFADSNWGAIAIDGVAIHLLRQLRALDPDAEFSTARAIAESYVREQPSLFVCLVADSIPEIRSCEMSMKGRN